MMVGQARKPENKQVESLTEEEAKRELKKRRAEAQAKGVFLSRIRTETQYRQHQGHRTTVNNIIEHVEKAEENDLMSRVYTDETPEYDL
jgi:hypothetical protein